MATTEMTKTGGATSTKQGASSDLAHDADKLKDSAKQRVRQEADKRKGDATKAAKSASSALEKAAKDLKKDKDAPAWLASAFEQTASKIESFAGDVEERSPDQIGRDVNRFASQNPAAFLAASAAAGFAAARFLRAGAEYKNDHQGGGERTVADPGSPQSGYRGAEGGTIL